jgi:hypothetical protein
MANLVSPGVEVNVIDESFYTPAQAGTTPMIFVATAQDKSNSSGTGIAEATRQTNAGTPFLLTSQRELADLFGDPVFQTDANNNPVHAGELNEYGLQAAYSVLGVTNSAWVTRADINLSELEASAEAPAADPEDGTYWLDTLATDFGVFEWNGAPITQPNGQSFVKKTPIVVTDVTEIETGNDDDNGTDGNIPRGTVGSVGDYAVVFASTIARLFYRNSQGTWVLVGSDAWQGSWAAVRTTVTNPEITTTGTFEINSTSITVTAGEAVADIASEINTKGIQGITAEVVDGRLEIYSDSTSTGAGDSTLAGEVVIESLDVDVGEEIGLSEGTFYPPALQISKHTQVPQFKDTDVVTRPTGSVWLKTTEPGGGANWSMKVYNATTQLWEEVESPLFPTNRDALFELDRTGGGLNIGAKSIYVQTNVANDDVPLATFKIYKRAGIAPTTARGSVVGESVPSGEATVTIEATQPAQAALVSRDVTVSYNGASSDASDFVTAVNSAGITGLTASVDSQNRITLQHATGGDIRLTADTSNVLNGLGFSSDTENLYATPGIGNGSSLQASLWKATENQDGEEVAFYAASDSEVTALTADGRLWYNAIIDEVDIMVHNGDTWVGYASDNSIYSDTDPNGPIVSASRPTQQSDGTILVTGDVWVDTSDIENYPQIYVYNADLSSWRLVDNTDQTTENGIVFGDARYNTSGRNADEPGSIVDLLESSYLDPDAPDPTLYPRGMLLWNTRRSGFNVKRFVRNWLQDQPESNPRFQVTLNGEEIDEPTGEYDGNVAYYPHRWVTESRNQRDGSGSFGRIAQRQVVVQALQAEINSNDAIRDIESRNFNLIATPGYPELIGEMVTLNYDRDLTGFVVGDVPARLTPDATSLNDWASNVRRAVEDNINGLVTRDEYLGIFYPWGFTSDNFGNNVVVPPSYMILRTILLSDQVSYPWFAPAGTRRGGITNATAVGYVDEEGEFVSIALNQGQRDVLYENNVNPITFLSGAGLVNYGQKTRARGASALDRINVARLTVFMRTQLNQLAKPYIFEQNDKITRDEIKQAVESLLLELVGQRALNDFLVVCDESNNTPSRIDRNELYVDIAIEPVKAVEFIYIPLRLKNTGEIAAL